MPKFARFLTAAALALLLHSELAAQHKLLVPRSGDSKLERVLDFDSGRAIFEQEGKRRRISSGYYYLNDDSEYSDGHMLVNRPNAAVTDYMTHLEFGFGFDALPDRNYKNCFVVLHLHTSDGRSLFVPKEIGNLKGGKSKRISGNVRLGVPVSQGRYDIYVFSDGKEIYQAPTEVPLRKRKPDPIESRSRGSLSPELAARPTNGETLYRNGAYVKGEASVRLTVVDSGYGIDHQAIEATSERVAKAAIDLIKTARFSPGAEDGVYVPKAISVRMTFNGKGTFDIVAPDA